MTAKGFAAVVDGVIDVRTVMPTRIGAIVNRLIVTGTTVPEMSDHLVEQLWAKKNGGVAIREVVIYTADN